MNRPAFEAAIARGCTLLCANPDIVVDRGHAREWCAGALAELYVAMGGEALWFGKPHAPIYDLARERLAVTGPVPPDARIVCVGDGPMTDLRARRARGSIACSSRAASRRPRPGRRRAGSRTRRSSRPGSRGGGHDAPVVAIGFLVR